MLLLTLDPQWNYCRGHCSKSSSLEFVVCLPQAESVVVNSASQSHEKLAAGRLWQGVGDEQALWHFEVAQQLTSVELT